MSPFIQSVVFSPLPQKLITDFLLRHFIQMQAQGKIISAISFHANHPVILPGKEKLHKLCCIFNICYTNTFFTHLKNFSKLTKAQRKVIETIDLNGMSVKSFSKLNGCSVQNTYQSRRAALKIIKKDLE